MQKKNLIFLTMSRIVNIGIKNIYTELLCKFSSEGWNVFIVSPRERSLCLPTGMSEEDGVHILGVRTLNLQKTSTIEKGLGQVSVEMLYKRAIMKYLKDVRFDLILYSTPPITFPKVIAYLKRQNPQALTYLLLKDIFPQNAVDLGMMSVSGVKGLLYRFFRKKEKKLYALSDYIGCMSPANVEYIIRHNNEISKDKVEVAPNSVELRAESPESVDRLQVRKRYGLPVDKPVFIYGGNLGKPQGIPFLMECLEANANRQNCHFVVIGSGTELPKLQAWYNSKLKVDSLKSKDSSVVDSGKYEVHSSDANTTLVTDSKLSSLISQLSITVMKGLPKAEYDELVRACDVGLIFLDHRFTIPNFPSRLLSYLENKMPVLCATDPNTDMGRIAEENGFGFWCESNSVEAFTTILDKMIGADRKAMGENGYAFLKANYTVENTYNAIMKHVR